VVSDLSAAATSDLFMAEHDTARAIRDIHALMVPYEIMRRVEQSAGAVLLGGKPTHAAY
jgi:hypothetical protein